MRNPTGKTPTGMPQTPRKSFALLVFVVSAVLFISSGIFAVWASSRAESYPVAGQTPSPTTVSAAPNPAAPDWAPYVDAGERTATNLTSVDHRTVDADVERILDGATGDFRRDFAKRAESFKDATRSARSVSTGTVTGAGLERLRGDHADVLVAVNVDTVSGDAPRQEPRSWRIRIGIVRNADEYQADSVEFIG